MAYSKKDTKYLLEEWEKEQGIHIVRKLCVALNKTPKSIIAKLSKEGVYQKQTYRDKRGCIPIKKSDLVAQISAIFAPCGVKILFPGLDKAPKQTLISLLEFVKDQDITLEECLAALSDASETNEIKSVMLRSRLKVVE